MIQIEHWIDKSDCWNKKGGTKKHTDFLGIRLILRLRETKTLSLSPIAGPTSDILDKLKQTLW